MKRYRIVIASIIIALLTSSCTDHKTKVESQNLRPYPEEQKAVIGRGLVALPMDNSRTFVSWRLLPEDPPGTIFRLYRSNKLIAQTDHTHYVDTYVEKGQTPVYQVSSVLQGKEGDLSREARVAGKYNGQGALVFNIDQNYKFAHVATGDLNGDGELEVVIAYANDQRIDPYKKAWRKSEDTIKVAAFLHTGERMWTIDLGWGIEVGGNYSPMVIWDIDADGRAEVILKTNKSNDRLDYQKERLTILNGMTGKIIRETAWPIVKGHFADDYNNNSRNYIAIAHLDGKNPSIIAARGLYGTQVICAYDNHLNKQWERIIGRDLYNPIQNVWLKRFRINQIWDFLFSDKYRGSHRLPIADINEDGAEEILWGEHCIGPEGKDLWKVKDHMPYIGHPDIVFAADVIPSIKGKEIYYCREGWRGVEDNIGMLLVDCKGNTIWSKWGYTHIDGGWVAKILADQEGMQSFGYDIEKKIWTPQSVERTGVSTFLWGSDGTLIDTPPKSWLSSFPVDWDGDGIREICIKGDVQKYRGPILARLGSAPLWGADLFGDQREEIVVAPGGDKVYILFNTENIDSPPRITLIADRQYKNDLSRK